MRDPRLSAPTLVLAAHGSTDPRFAEVVDAIGDGVCVLRPGLAVRIGYLDHGPPHLADVVDDDCVVVPLLLSRGYHVRTDIPERAAGARIADAVGPDVALSEALTDRLVRAGWVAGQPVVLAAAGSADERSLDDVRRMAAMLSERLDVDVTAAFVSAGSPRVAEALAATPGAAVASYLVAPGAFHDMLVATGAAVVSAPIGDHPSVAGLVLSRYDETCQGQPV